MIGTSRLIIRTEKNNLHFFFLQHQVCIECQFCPHFSNTAHTSVINYNGWFATRSSVFRRAICAG